MKINTLYKRAILAFFLIGTAIFLPIFIIYALSFGLHALPEWLLVAIFGCISPFVSGMGYKGKLLDKTQSAEDSAKTAGETIGLVVGVTAALTVSILALIFHEVLPFGSVLGEFLGTFMLFVMNASLFMGLCSRSGRVADYFRHAFQKEKPLRQERVNYVLAISVGIFIGVAIVAVTLATGGAMGALAAIACVSSCASASGYIGICFDVVLGKRTLADAMFDSKSNDASTIWDRLKSPEAIGTLIGVGIGIVIAISIISCGVSIPIIGGGLLAGISMVSAAGGLGNRLGHLFTKIQNLIVQPVSNEEGYEADDESQSESENTYKCVPKPAPQSVKEEKWEWKKDTKTCPLPQYFNTISPHEILKKDLAHAKAFSFSR